MAANPRIVSLLPSATEIVFALDKGPQVIGRSHECDYPAAVRAAPVCSRPRLDPAGSSQVIDADIKRLLEQGLSVFEVDSDALAATRPDIVLTQTQCEVCAVSLGDIEAALAQWTGTHPELVSLQAGTLADLWRDIMTVAGALHTEPRGHALVERLKARIDQAAVVAPDLIRRPKIACIEWIEPLMAAGNWVPELVEAAGGRDVLGKAGEHSPWLSWETLAVADPDIIVVMPCGFNLEKTCSESQQLKSHSNWLDLRAVRNAQAFAVDGHQYFNRPGPRLVDSVAILRDIIAAWRASAGTDEIGPRSDSPLDFTDSLGQPRYIPIN